MIVFYLNLLVNRANDSVWCSAQATFHDTIDTAAINKSRRSDQFEKETQSATNTLFAIFIFVIIIITYLRPQFTSIVWQQHGTQAIYLVYSLIQLQSLYTEPAAESVNRQEHVQQQ